jgi:tripartite-type tricarboxylate transporter receptor subunit TctC
MMDVIGGRVQAGFAVSTYVLPHIRAGKLRPIGVGTLNRFDLLPDVPTLDEAGIKGYDASNWYAIAAPAGTPKPIMMKLHNELKRFFTSAKTVKTLGDSGVNISIKTTEEMRKIIPAEIEKWTKIAIAAGMPGVKKK